MTDVSLPPADPVERLLRAIDARDTRAASACLAPDVRTLDVAAARLHRGVAAACVALDEWHAAFSGLRIEPRWLLPGPGQATLVWRLHGTHTGSFLRIPPTGTQVCVAGTSVFTIHAGRIARHLVLWDQAGLLRQLRLLPDLPGAEPPEALLTQFLAAAAPST